MHTHVIKYRDNPTTMPDENRKKLKEGMCGKLARGTGSRQSISRFMNCEIEKHINAFQITRKNAHGFVLQTKFDLKKKKLNTINIFNLEKIGCFSNLKQRATFRWLNSYV